MRVYIDSNLGHHIAQGCEDLYDTCGEWIAVCEECDDRFQDDPNWTRVGVCALMRGRQ